MKAILLCANLLSCVAGAASYYVSPTGSDSADGSIGTPWQTLAHASGRTFTPGDTIHLAKGGTWLETWTFPTNGLTLTAYGSGELPIIDAEAIRTEAVSCGTRTGTTTSFLHLKGGTGVSGLWEASAGTNTIEDCVVENHPDSCISAGSDAHIVVRRCIVRGAGDDGITLHVTASAEVYSCTITNNRSGINNSGTTMEMTVEDTTFADNGDGSSFGDLSMGTTASTFRRCWFKGRSDGGAWKFFEDNAGGSTTFDYCVFDAGGANATTDPAVAVNSAVVMRNCLLYGRSGYGNIAVAATGSLSATNTVFLNWWRAAYVFSGGVWRADHCSYHTSGTSAWQSHTSNTSEVDGDPLLADPANYDYSLQAASPCIDAGSDVGLTVDFDGNAVTGSPDIGPLEYQTGGETITGWLSSVGYGTMLSGQGTPDQAYWAPYVGGDAPSASAMGWMYSGHTNLHGEISLGRTLAPGAYSVVLWARPYGTYAAYSLSIGGSTSSVVTPSNVDWRYPWQDRVILSAARSFSNVVLNVSKTVDPTNSQKLLVWGAVVSPDTNVVVTKFNEVMRLSYSASSNRTAVTSGNVLENSSFELGLPAGGWWNETWNNRTNLSATVSQAEHSHGNRSAIATYHQSLRSRVYHLRPDQVYTLSFRAKGSSPSTRLEYGLLNATAIPSGFTNPYPSLSKVYIGTEWTNVTVTNVAWDYPSPSFYVVIGVDSSTPTALAYVDEVQLEEGPTASAYAPRPVETKLYITNAQSVFYESDAKNAVLRVANFSGSDVTVPVTWAIHNALNELVSTGSSSVRATNGGVTETAVSIDPGQFGHFSAAVTTWGSESETVFSVVRDPFTGDPWSSVVGVHPTLLSSQSYATTAKKLNPWGRLLSHAGLFAWDTVEVTDGAWTWDRADFGVASLTNAGTMVLGTLYERPAWVSDYPDQAAWVDYVSNVVSRYSQVVDVWEIDNEPQYLVAAQEYATMLSNAVVAIKTINPANRVACFGGASTVSWVSNVLAYLPANWITNCDVASIHLYPGLESGTEGLVGALSGAEVWNTESGNKTKGGQRSLDGNFIVYEGGVMGWEDSQRYQAGLREQVDGELQNIAWIVGHGARKTFRYDARLWANSFDHQYSSIEQDDSIRPIGVMAAAADWMLRGMTNRAVLGSATSPLFAFNTERGPVAIAWSASISPRVRTTTLAGKYRPVDPFGNVGAVGGGNVVVSYRPTWLLSTNVSWSDWTNGLAVADSAGSDAVAPNVSVIGGWDGTVPGTYPVRFVGIDDVSFPGYTNSGVLYRTKINTGLWSDWASPSTLSVTSDSPFRVYVQAKDDAGNTGEVDRYFGPSSSPAPKLLILTEPTARGYAGPVFDRWVAQITREGWSVLVREAPRRWGGNFATNDWSQLNWMSNEVRRANPDAVQLFGSLAKLKTGGHQADGHDDRCILTHHWLGCTNLTFTDALNWSNMVSAPIDNHIPNSIGTNAPGDGIPDQIYGTFSIPVSSIDASGLTSVAGNFSSGYLAGQPYQPAIDEGHWLRVYLTNNLLYRLGEWSVTDTGHIDSGGWLNSSTVTATNNSVAWTVNGSSVPGSMDRWVYDNVDLASWSPDFVTSGGAWMRAFWVVTYKSYCQEDANGQGVYRRFLFPGFAPRPLALFSAWAQGQNSAQWFPFSRSTNVTVADAIRSSVVRFGGIIPFEMPLAGDLTLPMHAVTNHPPSRSTIGTLTIQ